MLPLLGKLKEIQKKTEEHSGFRVESGWPFFILGLVLIFMSFVFAPDMASLALSISLFLAPLWMPALILGGVWSLWVIWRRSEFINKQKMILLEIKPPRGITKTPLAMEAFLAGIHIGLGEGNWHAKYIKGSVRPWWSLEIASLEGNVHFYIWTREINRRLVETQIYAQYPGAQIVEAPDYTRMISATTDEWSIWGCDYKHETDDPIPIKTYVEYGLDRVQKEEEQTDPFANIIEFMGSIGKGEYLWLQYVIRVHKGEKYNKKNGKGNPYTWKDKANELIKEFREETRMPYVDSVSGKEVPGFPNPTKGQMEKIAAIERNVSKLAFDVGARAVYFAKKQPNAFNLGGIYGLIHLFKQFNVEGWNKLSSSRWLARFQDYPWEFRIEKLKDEVRTKLVDAYRRRQFFYEPFSHGISSDEIMVMSTEEIATLFHLPSRAIETPGMARIQSTTSEAPANLPT